MTQWQAENDAYLSAALHWLRECLRQQCGEKSAEITQATDKYQQLRASAVSPAMVQLAERFGLSAFEQDVLLLCVAHALDTRIPALCAQAQDNLNKPYPTFALAMVLFDQPAWEALAPTAPLRHWQLIRVETATGSPLASSALAVDERIVSYVKGLNYLDEQLAVKLTPFSTFAEGRLAASQEKIALEIAWQISEYPSQYPLPLVQLVGADILSKQQVACKIAAALGLRLRQMPIAQLPASSEERDTFARLWQRESTLLPMALFLDAQERSPEESLRLESGLGGLRSQNTGLIFLSSYDICAQAGGLSLLYDIEKPTTAEQRDAWQTAMSSLSASSSTQSIASSAHSRLPDALASQFSFNLPVIDQILEVVAEPAEIWQKCREQTRPQLSTLAQRLAAKATWDDIVLPEAQQSLLRNIEAQVRQRRRVYDDWGFGEQMNRGFGISVLFAGESGTGKTMAAEVLANALDLDLYRIDLSGIVNKYIGETEKNLRKLFDAAEESGAILFFDEADALFGKRSEVKDSHDRYANIEVNYLLQRVESYRGLAILATNMKSALDTAFMRRLRFVVDFSFPGQSERKTIWKQAFPAAVPGREDLDYDWLARFNLSGGSIHNIALNSAFLAADSEIRRVTMPVLLKTVKIELEKMEVPINQSMFHPAQHSEVRR